MKREILFRGKSKSTGEWVFGNLFDKDTKGRTHIGTTVRMCFDIDPETVGQFTGITDINDIKIFEGDIAKYYNPYSKQWYTHIVKCDKMFASFGFFTEDSEWCKENDWLKIECIEVIGNIHDNKELLK